ncbi:protein retinal degeneration B-like [Ctenocephalides felis]|uniref:protein retinal degeneration B-like n=1 Tax=Ctenocephalides felis TaxID=7515 RepID=UPI000E6E1C7C|nr:protein retinal degeneration B-like [Ctenocephalides felis]
MLIKEYRIPLPLTVEEYRIAQLYMIAKKSREESSGAGSGVEILINEPYEEGPGGKGQYTRKVYHVGSHLPGWFKGLLPKSALTVEEEAWNAYPYTKTRYTCPFVEKFSLEIETYYYADDGHQDNVFNLAGSDYRNRIVDVIDVVKDQLYGADYVREEDPKFYISEKTNRGPLNDSWLEYYWNNVKDKPQPTPDGLALMCAYKLCRVEFRYWGMQTKLEKFIHDVGM